MRKPLKEERKAIAKERIKELFEQAKQRPEYSKRYMQLAKKLKERHRLRFSREQARKVCKKCCAFLSGRAVTVRTKDGHVVYTCEECGNIMRYPYVKEKKVKK